LINNKYKSKILMEYNVKYYWKNMLKLKNVSSTKFLIENMEDEAIWTVFQ